MIRCALLALVILLAFAAPVSAEPTEKSDGGAPPAASFATLESGYGPYAFGAKKKAMKDLDFGDCKDAKDPKGREVEICEGRLAAKNLGDVPLQKTEFVFLDDAFVSVDFVFEQAKSDEIGQKLYAKFGEPSKMDLGYTFWETTAASAKKTNKRLTVMSKDATQR